MQNKISRSTFCICKGAVSNYTFEIYNSIQLIRDEWAALSPENEFFSFEYLHTIEFSGPRDIIPYYAIVKEQSKSIGIVYFQTKNVKLNENLRKTSFKNNGFVNHILQSFKQFVISRVQFHTIICGNLLVTGPFGFHFVGNISNEDKLSIVQEAAGDISNYLKNSQIKPGLLLIKDLFDYQLPLQNPKDFHFTHFQVQPKMMIALDPQWKNWEDYISSLKSKYRVRAKKAFQKLQGIRQLEFDTEQIQKHSSKIWSLYRNISDQADFNAFVLPETYFETLKQSFGDRMKFITYWKDEKMVAFFTTIKNYDNIEAHFLGYDAQINHEHQIYLNMLLDMIKDGIKSQAKIIDLSRTAIEIKSTVGAKPYDMHLYLKHANPIINQLVKPILKLVKPKNDFIIRSPFHKDSDGLETF